MNIGARIGCWSGGLSAKSYVQSGLIAMWDGIENTGWGTHDFTTTVWKNLINSSYDVATGSLGEFESDCFHFTTTMSAQTSGTITLYPQTAYTYEVIANDADENTCEGPFGVANGFNILYDENVWTGVIFSRIKYTWGDRLVRKLHTVAYDGSTAKLYLNGNNIGSSKGVLGSEITQKFRFGNIYGSQMNKYMCCVRVYNRLLSDTEITHNYAIDKARFGLT